MYIIELSLKLSPFPLSVQRKSLKDAQLIYQQISEAMHKSERQVFELICEKVEAKKIMVLISEISAVQIYEKTAAIGGAKRPGFSFESD